VSSAYKAHGWKRVNCWFVTAPTFTLVMMKDYVVAGLV